MNKYLIENYKDSKLNIFTVLSGLIPSTIITDTLSTNIEFTAYVGNRKLSSLMDMLIDEYSTEYSVGEYSSINNEGIKILKNVITDRFKDKWTKLIELMNMEYDPLSPFNIKLTETHTDLLNVTQDSRESKSVDKTQGFNSVDGVETDSNENSSTSKYSRENPRTRDYTRTGNIGNQSRQELVLKQREVLQYQFIQVIFQDLASVLCRRMFK